MERLTRKISKTMQDKYSLGSYLYYDFANVDDTNKLLNKLGMIEDLMEKYNIENLEQLDIMLFVLSGQTKYRLKEIQEENQTLKDRWENLKGWVIDTKPAIRGANTLFIKEALLDKIFKLEKGEN